MPPRKRKTTDTGGGAIKKKSKTPTDQGPVSQNTRVTRACSARRAEKSAKAVFNTTELLEQILLNLPAKNVFAVQRVNTFFRDVIRGSISIRRALFLEPLSEQTIWKLQYIDGRDFDSYKDYVWNVGDVTFVPCQSADDDGAARQTKNTTYATPVRLNPLLKDTTGYEESLDLLADPSWSGNSAIFSLAFKMSLAGVPSWRDTYITAPPCKTATFRLVWRHGQYEGGKFVFVEDAAGLTLGTLVDNVLKQVQPKIHFDKTGAVRGTLSERDCSLETLFANLTAQHGGEPLARPDTDITCKGLAVPGDEDWAIIEEARE